MRRPPRIPASVLLGAIIVAAALLRASFFVGLVSGDPQDDVIYYRNAFALFEEKRPHLEQFRSVRPTGWPIRLINFMCGRW